MDCQIVTPVYKYFALFHSTGCLMDWSLCIICQKKTRETLKCPLDNNKKGNELTIYQSLIDNANRFSEL